MNDTIRKTMNCNSKDGDDGCDYENKGEDENGDEDEDKDEDEGEDDDATATAITMLETTMTCTTSFFLPWPGSQRISVHVGHPCASGPLVRCSASPLTSAPTVLDGTSGEYDSAAGVA